MKLLIALALVATILAPQVAFADASTDAALALGAFAVLTQILTGQTIFHQPPAIVHVPPPAVYYYVPPPASFAPAPPPVYYPQGTWVFMHGYWVWVPKHSYTYHGWDDDDDEDD